MITMHYFQLKYLVIDIINFVCKFTDLMMQEEHCYNDGTRTAVGINFTFETHASNVLNPEL